MKRVMFFIAGLIVTLGGVLLASPPDTQAISVNAFTITSFDAEYELKKDAQQRSVLVTKETITANFPYRNVNRGIERAIPHEYKGHPTSLSVASVQDESGMSLQYSTRKDGDATVLRIGNPDRYVHGVQTYVITYTQRDVTHYFENTQRTEWYWDTNGTQWRVPIQALSVKVTLDESIRDEIQGAPMCYQGASGSTDVCTLNEVDGVYYGTAQNFTPGDNMTLAFGFNQDVFTAYTPSFLDVFLKWWRIVFFITIPLGVLGLTLLSIAYSRKRNRSKELKPIPVEYIPPRGVSVLTSGQIVLPSGSVFAAQLIDFAVRRYIAVIETKPKSGWRPAEYDIEIVRDPSELLAEELEILSDMFGRIPVVGERLSLKALRSDYGYASRTIDNDAKLTKLIHGEYALREQKTPAALKKYFRKWAGAFLVLMFVTFSPVFAILALIAFSLSFTNKPLTDRGLALRRYLFGLSRYIKAAEKDRLKMLQGPDTADKVGERVDTSNPGQIVKLYERVLPYAILFGHELEWTKRLADFYVEAHESPGWYSGTNMTAFNAATFVAAIHSFSYAASSSGGSSSSSSSGGSGGGGSSGGGGGGGGGGGW